MTYSSDNQTDNHNERIHQVGVEKSSGVVWLIAGIVVVLAIIGLISWDQTSGPVAPTATTPQVENKVNIEPPTLPVPDNTTTMDAQPPADAPATTTVTPTPAEVPPAPATVPAQPPATNP